MISLSEWIRACGADELEEGKMISVDCNAGKLLVAKQGGKVYAIDRICTHAEADLSTGFLSEEGVRCPLHLSVFGSDGAPKNPPATEPVRTYNVKIQPDGVYVEV